LISDSRPADSKYLDHVRRSWRTVFLLAVFFGIGGWWIVWNLPNVYQSETRVRIDTKTTGFEGPPELRVRHDLAQLIRVGILHTANLEKVAIENDLLLDVGTEVDKLVVLEDLRHDVGLVSQRPEGPRSSVHLLTISYRDGDAERSRSIVSSFLEVILETLRNRGNGDRSETLIFLDDQIERYRALLSNADDKLRRFRIENVSYESKQSGPDMSEPVFSVPEIENEFHKLSRDYKVLSVRHKDFTARRERAAAISIENITETTPSYRVIEAPTTLPDPVEPNRPLLYTLVFIGAWVLGIAAALILDPKESSDS